MDASQGEEVDRRSTSPATVVKAVTGIRGFDEITHGGLPRGRATLITGAAGSGKSLFGTEFLVRGALEHGETGVLVTFEESTEDIVANAGSLGFDLDALRAEGLLVIDSLVGDTDDLVGSGDFDLAGLLIRLGHAIDTVGAQRVVLDTIEVLFASLPDEQTVRHELGRLLRWLKQRGMTVLVTGERGVDTLTRYGIEEYVSDCVVVLDQRVVDEVSTRRLRVAKYRGSGHATNEFPFLITASGLSVMPIGSGDEQTVASDERIGLGIPRLDEMLGGGVYRGTTTMISGTAGTGKTSIAASAAAAACARGERALFVSLEESAPQLVRNMRSIGLDLTPWMEQGTLRIVHLRPAAMGLEEHLARVHLLLDECRPDVVVIDAVASLNRGVSAHATASVVARDIDLLRTRGVTSVLTALAEDTRDESTDVSASSLVDTWMLLRNVESNGERNRLLFVIKNRGSAHSNQVREFVMSSEGPELLDVFVGPDGVLTGSRRREQVDRDRRDSRERGEEAARLRRHLEMRGAAVEAQVAALRRQLEDETVEMTRQAGRLEEQSRHDTTGRVSLAVQRSAPDGAHE